MNTLLEATRLYKSYNDKQVVRGVSFQVCGGEILGLLGPNGAGKSTIVGMLYGAVRPDSGSVKVMGIDALREGKRARSCLGIVPQDNEVDRDFTVVDYLDSFATYYGIPKKEREARVADVLSEFDIQSYRDKITESLSGGMRRRLMLARALLDKPKIIFLDEPTTGLDPDARQDFWRYVLALREKGCAVLLTTHYMDEAERLCDRLLLLKDGAVIDQGSPIELIEKFAGKEVVELRGIDEVDVKLLAERFSTWYRKFGGGYIIGLTMSGSDLIWDAANEDIKRCRDLSDRRNVISITRRASSLEDVFLIITGLLDRV